MHRDLESLKTLLLEVGHCRNPPHTLLRLCEGLAAIDGVALARLWLTRPGDICDTCPMRSECPDQTRCLHLAASAGTSLADLAATDRGFLEWILRKDFSDEVKRICRDALAGRFPVRGETDPR